MIKMIICLAIGMFFGFAIGTNVAKNFIHKKTDKEDGL